MSKFLRHESCSSCGSSDARAIYADGHSFCFHCEEYLTNGDETIDNDQPLKETQTKRSKSITPFPQKTMPAIKDRGIDSAVVNKYNVTVNTNPNSNVEAIFPRFDADGYHVANQIRFADKEFSFEGDNDKATLFGRHCFPEGGRSITVCEGYFDAMAAFQLTGSRYPNVGVQSASSAKKEVVNNFEYLNSFKEIVLNFDSDEPGQKAAKECAQLFTPGKVRILKLEKAKDANDYLMEGLGKEYTNEWYRAPSFTPDGLKLGSDLWGDILNHKTPKSVPYPWKVLNYQTYGIRLSEVTLLTAETGVGKTSIVKAIEHSLLTNPELVRDNIGVGFMHLEETTYDTAIGLMSIHAAKPFHLPDTERSEDELRKAYDEIINSNRVVIWDSFGSNDIETVLSKVRHMSAMGCKYIVLDHLSIIVSDQSGDERKQLDEISTKLKTLCMNLNIAVIAVIHLNRAGEIRGSAGPEQIANIVIRLQRDKKESDPWRRNITKLTVEKNRFCGRTGPSSYLFFDEGTGTLNELTQEEVDRFERGDGIAGHEFEAFKGGV